jgi:hypothetical protein
LFYSPVWQKKDKFCGLRPVVFYVYLKTFLQKKKKTEVAITDVAVTTVATLKGIPVVILGANKELGLARPPSPSTYTGWHNFEGRPLEENLWVLGTMEPA